MQVRESIILRYLNHVLVVTTARARGRIGQEVAPSAAKDEVYHPSQRILSHFLLCYPIFLTSHLDMSREAGRRGICDPCRHDQPCQIPRPLGRL